MSALASYRGYRKLMQDLGVSPVPSKVVPDAYLLGYLPSYLGGVWSYDNHSHLYLFDWETEDPLEGTNQCISASLYFNNIREGGSLRLCLRGDGDLDNFVMIDLVRTAGVLQLEYASVIAGVKTVHVIKTWAELGIDTKEFISLFFSVEKEVGNIHAIVDVNWDNAIDDVRVDPGLPDPGWASIGVYDADYVSFFLSGSNLD